MRTPKLTASLAFKVSAEQRQAVEKLAKKDSLGLGEAARELDAGIRTRGQDDR